MSSLLTLIKCLPEILALLASIEKSIEAAEEKRKVNDDILKIKAAFDAKDGSKLTALFSGTSDPNSK